MKKLAVCILSILIVPLCLSAAGEGLDGAIRPISNFVYMDSPDVGTSVHPIFVHHEFPNKVNTTLGDVDLGGDLQLYALQFEVALSDTLSLIAVKDGYVDFNPDNTTMAFSEEEGFADLAAGLKYVFHKDEEAASIASARLVVELPTGNDDVWQGNGDGTIDPAITAMKMAGGFQMLATVGYIYAIDGDAESSRLYDAWHLSYNVNDTFYPIVELNHFMVTDEGSGETQFNDQVGGAVPAVARFEGGDLVNLGSANGDDNEHFLSIAFGVRVDINDDVNFGAAYEFPLTDEEDSLMDSRVTLDLVVNL